MNEESLINSLQDTVDVLSEALSDIRSIAARAPLNETSLAIREIAFKAIRNALSIMEGEEPSA